MSTDDEGSVMSDFLQTINRITTVTHEIAAIAGQLSGRPVPSAPGTVPMLIGPLPGAMPPDRMQLTAAPSAPAPMPVAPAPASTPFMQVLSGWASQIAAFFKQLFASVAPPAGDGSPVPANPSTPAPPGGAAAPSGPSPAGNTVSASPTAAADAREKLFAMIPTGKATVYGFVGVTVSRQADRILVSAGSFGSAAVIKHQGEFFYQENNKQPVRVQGVTSSTTPSGDMRFAITLDSGKRVEAEILADGRTLRFDKYTLTLR